MHGIMRQSLMVLVLLLTGVHAARALSWLLLVSAVENTHAMFSTRR
jgi:hypothetical protein